MIDFNTIRCFNQIPSLGETIIEESPEELGFSSYEIPKPHKFLSSLKEDSDIRNLTNFKKGTTTLGFIFKEGIIIAVDSRASMGTFISSEIVRKVIEINDYLLGTMAGCAADCSYWERHLARLCRMYELRNKERIPVAAASNLLANIFYQYQGYGLSCGTMVAGCEGNKPYLYYVHDTGARLQGNLFSVGSGSTYAYGVLDSCYKYDLDLNEAVDLGKRAIYHATHRDGASGGLVRIYHVHKNGWTLIEDGKSVNELHYEYAIEKGMLGNEM